MYKYFPEFCSVYIKVKKIFLYFEFLLKGILREDIISWFHVLKEKFYHDFSVLCLYSFLDTGRVAYFLFHAGTPNRK